MVVYKVVMAYKDPVIRAAYQKQWKIDNPGYGKKWHTNNREERNIQSKQNYQDHREERKAKMRQSYQDNREERKIKSRQNYQDNREERLSQKIKYVKDHPEVNLRAQKKLFKKLGKVFDLECDAMRYAINAWSKTVRKRDNNKCTWCNSTKNLVSHHIWHKAYCPESALDVDNGITLCHDCHMEQHRLDRL